MPHSNSAKKRLRQDNVRRDRNRANKSRLRTSIKKINTAVTTGEAKSEEAVKKLFAAGQEALDTAARKNTIPKKRADRKKSRLAKQLQKALVADKA